METVPGPDVQTDDALLAYARARGSTVYHAIGTCRMGRDGDQAVCDPFCRAFDTPNLWICDNSVFPSSLAANPALTIMALSLRFADRFGAA